MNNEFTQVDFGPLQEYLNNDDVTDISYSNGGQVWLKTLSKGVYRVENPQVNNAFMEKMAFQCANSMGKSFNMANPFLDAESAELRMNFVHDSIAKNGIAVLIRKTPAKIRLVKEKIIEEDYIRLDIHDFLLKCVEGHCNILVSGETGSGKTEFIKYLAAHTKFDEKIITIEDTLELHLDRIFPERDIVAMKTNNIASYADVLVTCMRQNPRWILLSEVRSAEAVMAVRDSISSGHNILSTIHADKAESIPSRLYSLLESSIDMDQFLRSIHRYVQLGVHIKGYYSPELQRFKREVAEVVEFFVDDENKPGFKILYKRTPDGNVTINNPSKYLLSYLESQGVIMQPDILVKEEFHDPEAENGVSSESNNIDTSSVKKRENIVAPTNNVAVAPTNNVAVAPTNNVAVAPTNNVAVTPTNNVAVNPINNSTSSNSNGIVNNSNDAGNGNVNNVSNASVNALSNGATSVSGITNNNTSNLSSNINNTNSLGAPNPNNSNALNSVGTASNVVSNNLNNGQNAIANSANMMYNYVNNTSGQV